MIAPHDESNLRLLALILLSMALLILAFVLLFRALLHWYEDGGLMTTVAPDQPRLEYMLGPDGLWYPVFLPVEQPEEQPQVPA